MEKILPLEERSINEIYLTSKEAVTYSIPVYQRNYAWGEDEIKTLIKDVYDSMQNNKKVYYIGTLVTYKREDDVFEVIDGQQRLTTIYITLKALNVGTPKNKLTYSARKVSASTLANLRKDNIQREELDKGIQEGFKYAQKAIEENISNDDISKFTKYFLDQVKIIHYRVPKDVDLNHYFEVMNSRGEQLEKQEIVKSLLSQHLKDNELATFSHVWEACSEMNMFIQQTFANHQVFGTHLDQFTINGFNEIPQVDLSEGKESIMDLLEKPIEKLNDNTENDQNDKFQPIIDFPNFLLTVLKITRMSAKHFDSISFTLDDKELLNEFYKVLHDPEVKDKAEFARTFGFNLLKAKYLLDNYVIHHSLNDKELVGDNPWKLQYFYYESSKQKYPKNISEDSRIQNEMVHLLSMFEVAFTAKQRKNYLFYTLFYLFNTEKYSNVSYLEFLRNLTDNYFYQVYLNEESLTEKHQPKPNSFDNALIINNTLITDRISSSDIDYRKKFNEIYKKGNMDIPLFVFNYADYMLWRKYADELRGKKTKKGDKERIQFFEDLGCSDFELDTFNYFYFSRTRKSLEHYYPRANAIEGTDLCLENLNCFGNFAMIGSEANSSGNSWTPRTKLEHYKDRKSDPVSVASLKFKIMMQKCQDNYLTPGKRENDFEWNFQDMMEHQDKMLNIIIPILLE